MKRILISVLCASILGIASPADGQRATEARSEIADTGTGTPDRAAFLKLLDTVRQTLVETAEAMPATKYSFVPTTGNFANVRSFSRQIRHLAATNYILAAAAMGEQPPADAGDEQGPDSVVTKEQHLAYLRGSYAALERATRAIGNDRVAVVSSPISPLQGATVTRTGLVAEALIHAYDHYGQMVEYLRMNGIVPPSSRR